MPATIRRATRADAAQISEIIAELIREPAPVALSDPRTPAEVEEWMDRQGEHGAFFVVEDERGRLLGFATVDFNSAEPDAATFGAWIRQQHRQP